MIKIEQHAMDQVCQEKHNNRIERHASPNVSITTGVAPFVEEREWDAIFKKTVGTINRMKVIVHAVQNQEQPNCNWNTRYRSE